MREIVQRKTHTAPFTTETRFLDGDLKWSTIKEDHKGWLRCDGRLLSPQEYPKLFSVIGNTYGGDNDAFRLPDPRDRVLGAVGDAHNVGQSVGSETHTLHINEIPPHTHTGTTNSGGTHNHGGSTNEVGPAPYTATVSNATGGAIVSGTGTHSHTINNDGDHVHTFITAPSGSGQPHSVMQPTLFIGNIFIYSSESL